MGRGECRAEQENNGFGTVVSGTKRSKFGIEKSAMYV